MNEINEDQLREDAMKLTALLVPAFDAGCPVELKVKDGKMIANLNTGAKSYCHLANIDGQVKALMRYGKVETITSFEDVLLAVHSCGHGRSFFDQKWEALLLERGYTSPRGSL